jgi:hypothetical protein
MGTYKTQLARERKKRGKVSKVRKVTLSQIRKHPERWGEMKYLRYNEELLDASGQSVSIPANDVKEYNKEIKELRRQAREEARRTKEDVNVILNRLDLPDRPIVEDATVAEAMIYYANNIPWERDEKGVPVESATMEDMKHGMAVCASYLSIQEAEGDKGLFVEIPDESLKWLKESLEKDGSRAFSGVIAGILHITLDESNLIEGEKPRTVQKALALVGEGKEQKSQ